MSKLLSLRVLEEAGVASASYARVKRRLPESAQEAWRQRLSAACIVRAGLGPASLVLYDVSTLYFETDQGDEFREPGSSNRPQEGSWWPEQRLQQGSVSEPKTAGQRSCTRSGMAQVRIHATTPRAPFTHFHQIS